MKRSLHLFLGAWLSALLCAGPALAAEGMITLRMGHAGPVNSSLDAGLRNIAKEIQTRSNGAIAIQVYPQSQLGSEEVMLDSVASGTLDIAIPSTSVLATIIPQFNARPAQI